MVPKWFDKRPGRSHEESVADLRSSVHAALTAARSAAPAATLFDRARAWRHALAIDAGPNPLLAGFGPALVERAAIDALGRRVAQQERRAVAGDAIPPSSRNHSDDETALPVVAAAVSPKRLPRSHATGSVNDARRP
jgi:hypothetical protein